MPRRPALAHGATLLALLLTSAAFETLREDDLACESLVAEIVDCCENVNPDRFDCSYEDHGCGTTTTLTASEVACFTDKSCSALQRAGVCEFYADDFEAADDEVGPGCLH